MSGRELVEPERTFGKPPAKDSVQKIKALPERVDVGTQVVGSHHTFHVADLVSNGYHSSATAIRGAPEFQRDAPTMLGRNLAPYDPPFPLTVMFAPSRAGTFDAVLEVILDRHLDVHNNGGSEVREIKLHGAAKSAHDTSFVDEPTLAPISAKTSVIEAPKDGKNDVSYFTDKARDAAWLYGQNQSQAIHEVQDAAIHYKPMVKDAMWVALADLAIAMTVAGLAGVISKSVATSLLGAKPDAHALAFLTDFVKEGLKVLGKSASTTNLDKATNGPQQFFLRQIDKVIAVENELRAHISDFASVLRKLEDDKPELARAAMRSFAEVLRTRATVAREEQRRATTVEWMSALAKIDAGKVSHVREPTDMRGIDRSTSRGTRGVLQLFVSVDGEILRGKGSFVRYRHRVAGVSAISANELRNVDLRTVPLPIQIILTGSEVGFVTRNELGIIDSDLDSQVGTQRERDGTRAQQHRALVVLVDRILATPLADKTPLETDDRDPTP